MGRPSAQAAQSPSRWSVALKEEPFLISFVLGGTAEPLSTVPKSAIHGLRWPVAEPRRATASAEPKGWQRVAFGCSRSRPKADGQLPAAGLCERLFCRNGRRHLEAPRSAI